MGLFDRFRGGKKADDSAVNQCAESKMEEPIRESVGLEGGSADVDMVTRQDIGLASGPSMENERIPEKETVNPNVMGDACIRRSAQEENDSESVREVLSPEMDAYIQTQMAEQAAAEQAKDRDRRPVTEN
jgi:hypothetical protein